MNKTTQQVLVSAAIAGIMGAATLSAPSSAFADEKSGKCVGGNSCKGKSECNTAKNSCSGQNGCKGHGWKTMTQAACKKAKGKFEAAAEKMDEKKPTKEKKDGNT